MPEGFDEPVESRNEPIREKTKASVLDKLHRADAELKARRSERSERKKKKRDIEL